MAKPSKKSDTDEVERLKRELEAEKQARIEAEVHALKIESQSDLSRLESVQSEASEVAKLSDNREPRVRTMPFGITRIDF